jgi:hypothetical protein
MCRLISPLPLYRPVLLHQMHILTMVTRSQNNIHQPKQFRDGTIHYPLPSAFSTSLISNDVEPTSYTQAAKNVKWRAAMAEEFNALIKART